MAFHANGGGEPLGGTPARGGGSVQRSGRVLERVHSLSYHATDHKLILDVETAQTVGSVKTATVGDITIQNTGGTPAFAILVYKVWSDAVTMTGNVYHLNYLLKPGESIYVPDSPAVIADETVEQLAGTVVTNNAPTATRYVSVDDAGVNESIDDGDDTGLDIDETSFIYVGDLIRVDNEIMDVTAKSAESGTGTLTVIRGTHGSIKAVHDTSDDVLLPFFNAYHDFDRYATVRTDNNGKFKCFNFFGVGRTATNLQGITPGSIAIKFFSGGAYQNCGMSGITSSTNSGLTAGDEYKFNISVDGGGVHNNLAFTVDSSNTNFGGTNGIISKIQSALDTQYYTAGNLFEKKITVGIVNGDVRFASGSNLETSAILLAAPTSGTTPFGVGRIPAIGISAGNPRVSDAVASFVPDDVIYDPITYSSSPNTGAFMYDNGNGRLFGAGSGTINYETGAIDFTGLPNAEFVVSCLHTSAFSGRQNATDSVKMNSLKAIYGNTPNQKWNGELTVTRS